MFRKNLPVIVLEYYIVMLPGNLKVYIPGTFVTVLCTMGYTVCMYVCTLYRFCVSSTLHKLINYYF